MCAWLDLILAGMVPLMISAVMIPVYVGTGDGGWAVGGGVLFGRSEEHAQSVREIWIIATLRRRRRCP